MTDADEITLFPLMLIRAAGLPLRRLDDLTAAWPEENSRSAGDAEKIRMAFDSALFATGASTLRTAIYNARKNFFNREKLPPPAFREFLQASRNKPEIAQLIDCLKNIEKEQTLETDFSRQYNIALNANYRAMQQAARNGTLRRALLFASHDLLDRLPAFSEKPVESFNKKDRQTALSLLQYLCRAAAKTTPLSRFATVGLKRIGKEPAGDDSHPILKPQATPNVALLPALYEALLREPAFYRDISVALNPCITDIRQQSSRRKWLYFDGENESFQEMEENPAAGVVVQILLENGRKMPFALLNTRLEKEIEARPEQLQRLLFELIDYGLLEWELPEKGLSPEWCGGLYRFLAFLPGQSPVVEEAAVLLQWLRTAARSLSFMPEHTAKETQQEASRLAVAFFEKNGCSMPPLTPEMIFYEDVAEVLTDNVPQDVIHTLAKELAACRRDRVAQQLPPFRSALCAFAEKRMPEGRTVDFLDFCRDFLAFRDKNLTAGRRCLPLRNNEKIGALLQIFREESGAWRAVVNGLFPGGGKLFARWLHLFPESFRENLQHWNEAIAFPWQDWSNANFQPVLSAYSLAVPAGRTGHFQKGRQILLGNLAVKFDRTGLQLIEKETNKPVILTDPGLEAPDTRPPAMQVLWHLGVPYVSLEALIPRREWKNGGAHWRFADRIESGSLILARKTWQIDAELTTRWLSEKKDAAFFQRVRTELSEMGISRRFFGRNFSDKPQYFDLDSPLSILLFSKWLRQAKQAILLTEMLPLPEQCIVANDGPRAAEFVLEFTPKD